MRLFKRIAILCGVAFGLILLFYGWEDFRASREWNKFKDTWTAKGEKFEFSSFVPPAISSDQNFAMAPVIASSYARSLDSQGKPKSPEDTNVVNRLEMPLVLRGNTPTNGFGGWEKGARIDFGAWQKYYRDLATTTNVFAIPVDPQAPATDVLLALAKYNSILEEVRQAAALPGCRFPLNYDSEHPYMILLPHLNSLKGCVRILQLRAAANLELGNRDAAFADVILGLNLTQKLRSEPTLVSQLVRITMLQAMLQVVWEGLAKHRWTDSQLTTLDHTLAELDFVADYTAGMRAENACDVALADYLKRHPQDLNTVGESSPANPDALTFFLTHLIPSGWFVQNKMATSRILFEYYLSVSDQQKQLFYPSRATNASRLIENLPASPFTILPRMLLPSLGRAARKFAIAQTSANLCRVACALEQYRLVHGKYPDALELLSPGLMSAIPHDIIGGRPLLYHTTETGGFILYSIGWNEQDDNGRVSLQKHGAIDYESGDIVWQYPDVPKS